MRRREIPLTPVTLSLRALFANAWVVRWQATRSHTLLAAIEKDQLTLHSAVNGKWLVSVDLDGECVVVTEAQGEGRDYRFDGVKAAFVFMDALLLHYVARVAETDERTDLTFMPMAGAL